MNGHWTPLWYRSGVITRHCMPIPTESGREILVCASGYYGMGHETTSVYTLTLGKTGADEELLLGTDTFNWAPIVAQRQVLNGMELVRSPEGSTLRIRIRHGRIQGKASDRIPGDPLKPSFPTTTYMLSFALHGTHLQLAETDKALFGDLFKKKW